MDRFFLYVLILGFFKPSIGQNSNWYTEEYDGYTPCQLSWSPPGNFVGFTGHDINSMSYDAIAGALVFDVKTHSTNHGPLLYIK